jgi:hypothetical protein
LITGIDAEVLRSPGKRIQIPVGKRMSWAASRSTTREEDVAYCLLGIFGVNMPLLYGEGNKAFTRLQEQIVMTASTDLSLFAWRVVSAADDYSQQQVGELASVDDKCAHMDKRIAETKKALDALKGRLDNAEALRKQIKDGVKQGEDIIKEQEERDNALDLMDRMSKCMEMLADAALD